MKRQKKPRLSTGPGLFGDLCLIILPRAVEVEVGEDESDRGGDDGGYVALGPEEIREDGDVEQDAEQHGEEAPAVGEREADEAGDV